MEYTICIFRTYLLLPTPTGDNNPCEAFYAHPLLVENLISIEKRKIQEKSSALL